MRHVHECRRRIPALASALPVIVPEANLPSVALELMRAIKALGLAAFFMTEDHNPGSAIARDLPGCYTTRTNKLEMVAVLRDHYLARHALSFAQPFIVAAEPGTCQVRDVRAEFMTQMRKFSRIRRERLEADGSTVYEYFYSGKKVGANDDFPMTLCIGVFMHDKFAHNPKYAALRA